MKKGLEDSIIPCFCPPPPKENINLKPYDLVYYHAIWPGNINYIENKLKVVCSKPVNRCPPEHEKLDARMHAEMVHQTVWLFWYILKTRDVKGDQKTARFKERHQRFSLWYVYGDINLKAFSTNDRINVLFSPQICGTSLF